MRPLTTKSLIDTIKDVKVVSFDIFDTLLVRASVSPEDVWRYIEKRYSVVGFFEKREKAGADAETLDAAYELIPEFEFLKTKELMAESFFLHANKDIVAIWNEAGRLGKRRIIVSDMYLPSAFLKTVLNDHGIRGWEKFYLSCELSKRKDTGQLYEHIIADLGVCANDILHIGDNQISDHAIPKTFGIRTYLVGRIIDSFLAENTFAAKFLEGSQSVEARQFVGALAIGWKEFLRTHENACYWQRIGFLFAGVLGYAYALFLKDISHREHIDRLYFIARDGYLLEKIYNVIDPAIQTKYAYAPRACACEDNAEIKSEFSAYIKSLMVTEHTGIVDGCSQNLTAKKLFEQFSGKTIHAFQLVSFSDSVTGHEFIYAPNMQIGWAIFAELLLSAPTPPIHSVKNLQPVYFSNICHEEATKIEISKAMTAAALDCARLLMSTEVMVSADLWMDWIDSFGNYATRDDRRIISKVSSAVDYKHTRFVKTFPKPARKWQLARWKPHYPYGIEKHIRIGSRQEITKYFAGIIPFKREVSYL